MSVKNPRCVFTDYDFKKQPQEKIIGSSEIVRRFFTGKYNDKDIAFLKETNKCTAVYPENFQLIERHCSCPEPSQLLSVHTPDGYYFECERCLCRIPREINKFFPMGEDYKKIWVNMGILNNVSDTSKNIFLCYPVHEEIHYNGKDLEKFCNILEEHDSDDILSMFRLSLYSYDEHKDKIYYQQKVVSEMTIHKTFFIEFKAIIKKYIDFYKKNRDYPVVNCENVNFQILENLRKLKKLVSFASFKTNILPDFKNSCKNHEVKDSLIDFLDLIRLKKEVRATTNTVLTLEDLYSNYIQWYEKAKKEKFPDMKLLNKKLLKIRVDENRLASNQAIYNRHVIKGERVYGWKNTKVYLEE